MTRVLVPLADGVEEMEAVIIIDILRRAGFEVLAAGLSGQQITGSHGVVIEADERLEIVDPVAFDALVLPGGGPGVEALCSSEGLLQIVREFDEINRCIGAICAATTVLHRAGILEGRTVTGHPSVHAALTGCTVLQDAVVVDGHLVTSQGPGTAMDFALTLVATLDSPAKADDVAAPMIWERRHGDTVGRPHPELD